jgi:hypothetical protein
MLNSIFILDKNEFYILKSRKGLFIMSLEEDLDILAEACEACAEKDA